MAVAAMGSTTAATAAMIMGWYGPLIDLSDASSHVGDHVQLLVFVHSSHPHLHPLQKANASNGGSLLKTSILVSDDTGSYFSVSIWQKHMGSMIVAGDIILLQSENHVKVFEKLTHAFTDVKITKFRDVLEAATNQISSLLILVHSYELAASKVDGVETPTCHIVSVDSLLTTHTSCPPFKAIDELVEHGQLGKAAKAKLRRVVTWVRHTESALQHVQKVDSCQREGETIKNWKAYEETKSRDCLSISEALRLTNTCHANFHACIGEIFMSFISTSPDDFGIEKLLVSKRLFPIVKSNIVEDLICKGCKFCGSPMISGSLAAQIKLPLYCKKASNYHHDIGLIYRPFLLYVWDKGGQIPLLVKNKAAEILFGNITAEKVYKCYKEGENQRPHLIIGLTHENQRMKPNFHQIWLILLKTLLQSGQNSPFRFEITVDRDKDIENGRFELISFKMPCYDGNGSGKF